MEMFYKDILDNLIKVGFGMGVFVVMYISNMAASLYYNIKILSQPFDWVKIRDSAIKVVSVAVSTICLVVGVSEVIPFIELAGLAVPEEYGEVMSVVAMCTVCLEGIIKYGMEAYSKLRQIISNKKETDDK